MKYVLAVCLCLFQFSATAAPINLQLKLVVDTVMLNGQPPETFASPPAIGSTYFANITIDDAILASDGIDKAGKVLGFHAQIGDSIWDPSLPHTMLTDFAGFRGPCYGPISCTPAESSVWGLGSEYLGFDVTGGQVTQVYGGVYGQADDPFIDFLSSGRWGSTSFFRWQGVGEPEPGYWMVALQGNLSVNQVPEPGSPLLVGLGLMALRLARRRPGAAGSADSQ